MNAITINLAYAAGIIQEEVNRLSLDLAILCVVDALRAANVARDDDAKRACMRILNWLRADLRRVA